LSQSSNNPQRVVAVIPARYASTRFPGKPIVLIAGKPMIQWVYERTASADVDDVFVATDDDRIAACVRDFGGRYVMTSADHSTGTDRLAEAVCDLDAHWILNVQGDEPLVSPAVINRLIAEMRGQDEAEMGTVAVPLCRNDEAFLDPNRVKVVVDPAGNAMYFSRSPIPHDRDGDGGVTPLGHWGIYMYTKSLLQRFVTWPPSRLEVCEKLEQLRAMENGVKIRVLVSDTLVIGVDVPEDIARVESQMAAGAT
jgi:3-deoxy-manno-octulosonate cytidylyltransferase (CMP-KDO synthetase)